MRRKVKGWPALLPLLGPGLLAAAEATPARAAPVDAGNVLQVVLSLVAVLLLIGAMAWLLRRFAALPNSSGNAIRVLAGASLGQRERIVLVEVGKTQLLVGVAPGRVQTLHVFDQPVDIDSPRKQERFADRFAQALKRESPK